MNVVGRVSNLISQGVYSVATPFHPFGGAVDIIVVEQEDGTYRSTPWYVRFGKFQGVIKGAEKVVTIAVNDLEANFHMYLDSSGQAYFMQEVMTGSNDGESSEPVLNESNGMGNGEHHLETGQGKKIEENNTDPHGIFDENGEYAGADVQLNGSKDEQSAVGNTSMSNRFKKYHYGNLEDVEDVVKSSNDANSEMVLVSVDGHVLTVPISANEQAAENLQLDTPQFHLGPGEGSGEEFGSGGVIWEDDLYVGMEGCTTKEEGSLGNPSEYVPNDAKRVSFQMQKVQSVGIREAISNSDNAIASFTKEETFKSCLDLTSHDMNFGDMGIVTEDSLPKDSFELLRNFSSVDNVIVSEASVRDDANVVIFENIELKRSENNISTNSKLSDNLIDVDAAIFDITFNELSIKINEAEEVPKNSLSIIDMSQVCSTDVSINDTLKQIIEKQDATPTEVKSNQIEDQVSQSNISCLGFEISLCGNLLSHGMGRIAAEEAFNTHRVHEDVFKVSGPSIINSGNLIVRYKEMYFTWDKAVTIVLGKAVYGSGFSCDIKDSIPIDPKDITRREDMQIASSSSSCSSRRWRLWPIPFRRSRTLQHSNSDSLNEDLFVDTDPGSQAPIVEQDLGTDSHRSPHKQHFRTYIPSTEQIASLKLKDGQNMVAFSFSTRVLGKQQVDAHIYLWKWNTRIVISDVDGTITKSDVLGQVMPLVGKDWTQSGVARLFSAIKENGYQLLFLSARAIVQAYLTRSFLLNLKQDGKALPSGPVVISPDGLFPSLYREVIRRAPHEFKIACLEDIRALFPSDYNPFYAGFGNRDTDELSYKKIGIPKGKIFIINPKGEVAINHCIDVKSYTSLHTLVNDMFPPTSLVEQEDFNSWNYWKMPLPSIDC